MSHLHAGCAEDPRSEGALRLRGGIGSPCDALYSGAVEVYHRGSFAAFCGSSRSASLADVFTARVVCGQLGFRHAAAEEVRKVSGPATGGAPPTVPHPLPGATVGSSGPIFI